MAGTFAENFIAGHQAGQQRKAQEQAFQDAQEERGIRKMMLDLQLRHDKLTEAVQARELAKSNLDLQQGQPFADLAQPITDGQTNGQFDTSTPTSAGTVPQQMAIRPVSVPGVAELGIPGVSVKPRSMEELVAAQTAAKLRDVMLTPQKVGEGESVTIPALGSQPIAQGGPKPKDPWQTFTASYPTSLGKPAGTTYDQLTPQEQLQGFQKFHEINQDPEMRAAALALRAATAAAKNPDSSINQDKLEKSYSTALLRPFSTRSGGLGLEDQKVNQAIHLLALFDQNRDPKTGAYTIPKMLIPEATLGLARLVSPTGQPGQDVERELNQRTAKGDLAGVVTYLTGVPVTGSTQQVFQALRDSIERQGRTAEQNRNTYLDALRALAPTDLDETRRQKVEQALKLNSLDNPQAVPQGKTMQVGGFTVTVH